MDQQTLLQKIDGYIEANRTQIVEDLRTVIAHKSIDGEPAPGAPYGKEVREALDAALAIAQRMGLATNDGDGYVGWAELPGMSKEYLATVTHMDVVPEGTGWDSDPFTLVEKEGWLIARGTEDDKGPGILCLHALNFFKELGTEQPYTMRALLGCNEEKGMADIPYYLDHNPEPVFAFSPDTDFPVCHGEKGHFGADFVSPRFTNGNILAFEGGYASNVIPDRATCLVKSDKPLAGNEWITVVEENGAYRLNAKGIGGHAAHPDGTVNAIGKIVEYLLAQDVCTDEENSFLALLYKLHCATDGSGLGVNCRDEVFDPLTIIGGIISFKDGVLRQNMDSRFPSAITGQQMTDIISALAAQHGATLETGAINEPFYIPADAAPIQALLDTFNDIAGRNTKPYTMGGGTYARKFKNAVSFGPNDPEAPRPDFVGPVHGANEAVNLESMLQGLKIYIVALWKLQQLSY